MKAIILAGGKGRRLAPYTFVFPKPLVPVGNKPILDIILRQLARRGFKEVTLAVGHMADLITSYFKEGEKFGIKINYSKENKPLGTVGALSLVKGIKDTFLVMNGDVLTTLNYAELVEYHKKNGGIATIAMFTRNVNINLGVIELGSKKQIKNYIEKPTFKYKVSMGIYVFEPEILKYIKADTYLDFPTLIQQLIRDGKKIVAYPFEGYWLDIGRPEDYEKAQEDFDKIKDEIFRND